MSIWIILWMVVSAALIYFSAWTSLIVLRQKREWQAFANTHKLRFQSATLLTPPKMNGAYQGYEIAFFPSEHQTADSRGLRKLTAIEITIKSVIPCGGVVGTGGMVPIIQELAFPEELRPQHKWWNPTHIIKTDNTAMIEAYLTDERLKALMTLSKVKNLWMIFIFKGKDTILRIDTPDPLETKTKIEKILHIMIETAKTLELAEGEADIIKRIKPGKAKKAKVEEPETAINLQLEDDA